MSKIRVAVLRGGPSEEYEVSMKTGDAVLASLSRDLFEPLDITITKTGEWLHRGVSRYPEQILQSVDAVFIALHGAFGEDGKLQRILERAGVPFTGSRSYASSIAMNKVLTKDHLRDFGLKMPPHMVVTRDSKRNLHGLSESIADMFGPEYVIKPISSGSSVGTMMVKNPTLLASALSDALNIYDQVLVEKRIVGKEATCGVLNRFRGEELYALPAIEIIPPQKSDFFSADVKYTGETEEVCPGRFTHTEKKEMERIARLVHETLDLAQYSRSDFMIADDGIYFLEVNTLPGLTEESLFPKAMTAVGASHRELVHHLIMDLLR
ncbi:D-alanine--D-alanine ligase [Candidatus Parcubacteria bacterium]|uniref:D-alanine--D-alanine ligase n=1 Tax=Candidatus Kaiserbacteria bacterium CG10_big_fil_rev_8_21_14_0_10_47_16 TaxID=1974608 RepID=A0A2H0UES0_9BACT|nr:D-alanine--D-alanine ligase [Candidatus Parcubacteria bacterium]PIR84265.1 MAG: hypothetical protein COU16_01555 [Candidatus Kaiserbacteria bacterium CG10_big_fil_rev_8_21_14_0_10_47_16]